MAPPKIVNVRGLNAAQYEEIAAIAVDALCTIANYTDPEELRADEEGDDPHAGYGLGDADEVIEMAYDNVLTTARMAIDRCVEHSKELSDG